jgi:hypothetical protein
MRIRAILIVTLVGLATAVAVAQQPGPPGGQRRGGPPGGFGGFGMFGGGGASRLMLLGIPEVQKELELADEQVKEIQKLQEEFRARFRGPGGGPPGGEGRRGRGGDDGKRGDKAARAVPADWFFVQAQEQGRRGGGFQLTEEQRAEMEKQRLERAKEERAKLAEILLPHQLDRLTEIYVQVAGVEALQDELVAEKLTISDAQKTQIAEIRRANQEARGEQMRELFGGGGGGDPEAARAKMDELRKAGDAKLLAVLSADQQKKFEEMKGKPFKMPEGFGRGGFGGRGGPPGGERGRRGGNQN